MVSLHLPGDGGNGHRIMHAAAFYTAPTEGPGCLGVVRLFLTSALSVSPLCRGPIPKPSRGLPHIVRPNNRR